MLPEFSRIPVRVGRVAGSTVVGDAGCLVVRIRGRLEVGLVTGEADRRGPGKIPSGMTSGAVGNVVSLFQREKVVIKPVRRPVKGEDIVALHAIGGIAGRSVIRICRSLVIFPVAGDTIRAQGVKPQFGVRLVTVEAARRSVRPDQGKRCLLMQLRDVVDQPGCGRMAADTIGSHSLLVHIGMAGNTCRRGL